MKGRVLIIDNDREHCEALSASMQAFGYDVRTASSSLAAVEIAETFLPTAIVTDPTADSFDPFALLRALRTQQPHTPIILTARNSSIDSSAGNSRRRRLSLFRKTRRSGKIFAC